MEAGVKPQEVHLPLIKRATRHMPTKGPSESMWQFSVSLLPVIEEYLTCMCGSAAVLATLMVTCM